MTILATYCRHPLAGTLSLHGQHVPHGDNCDIGIANCWTRRPLLVRVVRWPDGEVVELFDSGGDVETVAFQVKGINGWDDVIVSLRGGRHRCYQIKHTRVENTLTFGDLVQHNESGVSLLSSLFDCWRTAGLNDDKTECILYTNREDGTSWSTTSYGIRRPPLLDFSKWLRTSVDAANSLAALKPPKPFQAAWSEWTSELKGGSDVEKFAFMQALTIKAKQDDLIGLEDRIRAKLAFTFGIDIKNTAALFNSLCAALRKWTTGHSAVTVEDLCAELTIEASPKDLAPPPPPPAPFFQTRIPVADELEQLLRSQASEPILFLTGHPGAGKTSVVSWLSNRRDDKPFGGLIGVRFYCFEPIRPDAPVVAPDASRVRPDELWCSLLSQLRSGLRGRLHELQVPLRNEFLSWSQARDHVLRLANQLGSERGQKFVIVIDGIDHAARAVQTMPQQIAQFFASLPGPDDLKGKAIRLLIAGQPPEHYRDAYPTWLTGNHPSVRRIDLPRLNTADVRALYLASIIALPAEQIDAAIRVIEDNAQGNTLATVFAIAEAESTSTLVALQKQLSDRRLADGLESYYSQIWNHMLRSAGDFAAGLDSCLAGSISMARRGVPAELLATAFSDWNRPIPWWEALLQSLGPLLTQGNYGFRVRHNDVRVFLSARFAGCTVEQRRNVASCLANYYEKTSDDRLTAHLQLIDLLELAGRASEAASVFTVDWVLEAATLGIDTDKLSAEACTAVCGLPKLRRWNLVVSVACAIQTFDRLSDAGEFSDHDLPIELSLPPFLPSEAGIRPLALWKMDDLQGLTSDVAKLVLCGELSRAMALLQRWLNGVTLGQLIGLLPVTDADRMGNAEDAKTLGQTAQQVFKELGRLCGTLSWRLPIGDCRSDIRVQARFAFERGFVDSINANTNASSLRELFALSALSGSRDSTGRF